MLSGSCAVCYSLMGIMDWSHRSGPSCDKFPLEGEDWDMFQNLEIPSGTSYYKCYLPMVSLFFCLQMNGPENKSQNLWSKLPGAKYHNFKDYNRQHILSHLSLHSGHMACPRSRSSFVKTSRWMLMKSGRPLRATWCGWCVGGLACSIICIFIGGCYCIVATCNGPSTI